MPKFTEAEREIIRGKLLEKGREIFAMYGLKKTSVDDLVNACGIAKGSFYKFFNSKEELYFELVEQEEAFREVLIAEMLTSDLPVSERLRGMFRAGLQHAENSPILRSLYERDEFELLLRKLPPERLAQHIEKDNDAGMSFIRQWQEEGRLIDAPSEVIVGMMRAVFLLTLHKKEIGVEVYPQVMELITDLLAKGLTDKD